MPLAFAVIRCALTKCTGPGHASEDDLHRLGTNTSFFVDCSWTCRVGCQLTSLRFVDSSSKLDEQVIELLHLQECGIECRLISMLQFSLW
jgi:hypothetical protein